MNSYYVEEIECFLGLCGVIVGSEIYGFEFLKVFYVRYIFVVIVEDGLECEKVVVRFYGVDMVVV